MLAHSWHSGKVYSYTRHWATTMVTSDDLWVGACSRQLQTWKVWGFAPTQAPPSAWATPSWDIWPWIHTASRSCLALPRSATDIDVSGAADGHPHGRHSHPGVPRSFRQALGCQRLHLRLTTSGHQWNWQNFVAGIHPRSRAPLLCRRMGSARGSLAGHSCSSLRPGAH